MVMSKSYKRADNCGPVPYPDGSGKMLIDDVVEGDEWAALIPLGFVVEVKGKPGKRLPESSKTSKPKTKQTRTAKDKAADTNDKAADTSDKAAKNDILDAGDNPSGDVNVSVNERDGADRVGQASARSADPEASAD